MKSNSSSLKITARRAGILYLIWILSGLFAMFYVPSQINTQADNATAAQNILSHESLFRISVVNDLASGALWVILVLLLYRLFKSVNDRQAKLLVAFVVVQIPVIFVIDGFNIASLMILKGELLKSFEPGQRQDLAMLFLRINDYGVLALEMFWGLWLFPLAILVYRSRFLPRFLGVWLAIDGFALVVLCLTSLLLPHYKDIVYRISFPAMLGEVAFMLWLLIKGADVQHVNSVAVE